MSFWVDCAASGSHNNSEAKCPQINSLRIRKVLLDILSHSLVERRLRKFYSAQFFHIVKIHPWNQWQITNIPRLLQDGTYRIMQPHQDLMSVGGSIAVSQLLRPVERSL